MVYAPALMRRQTKSLNMMKKILVLTILICLTTTDLFCQEFKKPSEGKTLVFFVRYRGSVALIDFKYYDGEKYLGKVSGNNYFIYECDPGEHVFWVSAENREFIKGNLKPNATYIIEVRPYFRAVMSGVELIQISSNDKKAIKKIYQIVENNKPTNLKDTDSDKSEQIESGMERYEAIKTRAKELNPEWTF